MRWPWGRRHPPARPPNGAAAHAAAEEAQHQLQQAHDQTDSVERVAGAARELARRTDRFTHDLERAWRLRETP